MNTDLLTRIPRPVRAGIVVEDRNQIIQAPPGAKSSEDAAPDGAEFVLELSFYKDFAPTALWSAATCRRFESADMSAHSKIAGDDVRSLILKNPQAATANPKRKAHFTFRWRGDAAAMAASGIPPRRDALRGQEQFSFELSRIRARRGEEVERAKVFADGHPKI
jgi:hypothetical protein